MNITTGGPHTLLFERDQQLATLLSSELQLAGYSNHTARTAVEVFDAIARYPIRLVLVNMAQAAAARREFWVALDSQRRDRKIQVLSFICTNLAGYGSREYEDTPSTNADMEIDGMLGLMSLVDAVRSRVPTTEVETGGNTLSRMPRVSSGNTSPISAVPRPSPLQQSLPGASGTAFRATLAGETGAHMVPPKTGTPTLSPATNSALFSASQVSQPAFSATTGPAGGQQPSYSEKIRAVLYPNQRAWNAQGSEQVQNTGPHAAQVQDTSLGQSAVQPQPVPQTQAQAHAQPSSLLQSYQNQSTAYRTDTQPTPSLPATESNVLQRMASGQINSDGFGESGLAQLSRMARGFLSTPMPSEAPPPPATPQYNTFSSMFSTAPVEAETRPAQPPQATQGPAAATSNPWAIPAGASYASLESDDLVDTATDAIQLSPTPMVPQPAPELETPPAPQTLNGGNTYSTLESAPVMSRLEQATGSRWMSQMSQMSHKPLEPTVAMHPPYSSQGAQPSEELNVKAQTLRASPIQDMPIERTVTGPAVPDANKRGEGHTRTAYTQQTSLNAMKQTSTAGQTTASPLASIVNPLPTPTAASPASKTEITAPLPSPTAPRPTAIPNAGASAAHASASTVTNAVPIHTASVHPLSKAQPLSTKDIERLEAIEYIKERNQQTRTMLQKGLENTRQVAAEPEENEESEESVVGNNSVLLDIVQSLPPMPALSQQQSSVQPQVLNGRATRSLNKVLLDGHLVPEDRLEVAQNIQRMLRGVDLNYQLGEILLMFKLLSPDQLLAASLVSYGLINTTQISALGRIRQELHAIGLEYDLENLLILFRILTPEQLREARSSIQS
jgi:hypothetical protein